MLDRGVLIARNDPFHFVFKAELNFLEMRFLQQILGTEVNRVCDLLQLQFAQGMLLGQLPEF